MLRIGLDIHGTIADFDSAYLNRFKKWPKYNWAISRNVEHILIKERDFWLNLPILRMPNFIPRLYCSSRVNNKRWTKKYLKDNGFPDAFLYQIPGYKLSKYEILKGRVDVFIEDSLKNFIDLNSKGIPCLLIDSPSNQDWGPIGRIYNLNYDEIEQAYYIFNEEILPYFNEII